MSTGNEGSHALIREADGASPRRFTINVFSNVVLLGLNIALGLLLTPYLIDNLGLGLYGLVPLAISMTAYLSVINQALNAAIGRYLTIDLKRGQLARANQTFNTALWTTFALAAASIPLALGLSLAVPKLFDVPAGNEQAAQWLFAAVMVAFVIGFVSSIFRVSSFAANRFDLQNASLAFGLLTRVGIIVILFSLLLPAVWQVGVGVLAGALVALLISIMTWRWLTPALSIDKRSFDRSRLRELLGMSGWMVLNQVGSLLFLNIDLIIINVSLGAEAGGGYGSVLQWSIMLRALALTASGVLTPIVLGQYAHGDTTQMIRLSRQAVKLLGLAIAFPVGVVCGLSIPLLELWLGPEFADLALVMTILTAHLCVNLAILPLMSLLVTLNKVRWPGIVSVVMGMVNLALAIWWVRWDSRGLGVALAGAIVLTIKNAIFIPTYAAHIQKLPWTTYMKSMLPGVLGAIAVGLTGLSLSQLWTLDSWFAIGASILMVGLGYVLIVYIVALHPEDRRLLSRFVPGRMRKLRQIVEK